jgi:D-sedoheptulose 7-phosphate isomerase
MSFADDQKWLGEYFDRYKASIFSSDANRQLIEVKEMLVATRAAGRKVVIAGNGGSAAIASHCAVDLTKVARVRTINFNEADLITCFANDYGYEKWIQKAVEFYADSGDVLVLISSSGKSPNVVAAAEYARQREIKTVTFTGFDPKNPLRQLGDINLWVDSSAYNIVEMTHHIWLLAVCDLIVGHAEYPPS